MKFKYEEKENEMHTNKSDQAIGKHKLLKTTNSHFSSLVSVKISNASGMIKKLLGISLRRVSKGGKEFINCSQYVFYEAHEKAKTVLITSKHSIFCVVPYFTNIQIV